MDSKKAEEIRQRFEEARKCHEAGEQPASEPREGLITSQRLYTVRLVMAGYGGPDSHPCLCGDFTADDYFHLIVAAKRSTGGFTTG